MTFLADVVRWFADGSHWQGTNGIPNRLSEHVIMTLAAVVTAAVICSRWKAGTTASRARSW